MRMLPSIIALTLMLAFAAPAQAADVCRTPDGYVFGGSGMGGTGINNGMGGTGHHTNGMGGTGINNGSGMGGTGDKLSERKGIGGTGIDNGNGMGGTGINGDIGVYGRITAFGSICVNGMEIEYKKSTPVTDAGGRSEASDLKVGQVVAVRAYRQDGEFRARKIAITHLVSGKITKLDTKSMKVAKETIVSVKGRDVFKGLRAGDYVTVSGLRRADGVIVAGHVEKTTSARKFGEQEARQMFGAGIKHFSVQGYVRSSENGRVTLTDGTKVRMGSSMRTPKENDRVILMGVVDSKGNFTAETLVPEVKSFVPAILAPIIKGDAGGVVPVLGQAVGGAVNGVAGVVGGIAGGLPSGVDVPAVDVPAVDVPAVEVPGLPPVDIPVIDVPPVDVPNIPVPPVIPDLPILPGR